MAAELARVGLHCVDPVAAWDRNGRADAQDHATALVKADLDFLRKADAILVDMSRPGHQYIGCICELTYAHLWGIPSVVWVSDVAMAGRPWLRYHATEIVTSCPEAVAAVTALVRR